MVDLDPGGDPGPPRAWGTCGDPPGVGCDPGRVWGVQGWGGAVGGSLAQNTPPCQSVIWPKIWPKIPNWARGGPPLRLCVGGVPTPVGPPLCPGPFRAYSMGDTVSKQTRQGLKSDLCLSAVSSGAGGKPLGKPRGVYSALLPGWLTPPRAA